MMVWSSWERRADLPVPVVGLDVVGESLGFLGNRVAVTVTVVVYLRGGMLVFLVCFVTTSKVVGG